MKRNQLWLISLLALSFLYLMGCKKKEEILVTGEGNTLFTQDFFEGLTSIEDAGKQKSIDDMDILQVMCQELSELELTEVTPTNENSHPIKYGHAIHDFYYADGSKKGIVTLGKQVRLIESDGKIVEYEANQEVSEIFRNQFNKIE